MTDERPKARLSDVSSHLVGFCITTYDVPVEALAARLPEGLTPVVVRLDGRDRALVSAVTFENTNFYAHFAPFVRLRCFQTNYRAYVMRGGRHVVWFFGTGLSSAFVRLPKVAWGLPWHSMEGETHHAWNPTTYDWTQKADGMNERVLAHGTREPLGRLPGFATREDAAVVLTHPLEGYLRTTRGHVATYGVWHERLALEVCEVVEARFEWFEGLGLVTPGQRPHSVLAMAETDFLVKLPPRKVKLS